MSFVSNTSDDVDEMLKTIGVSSIHDLFTDIPGHLQTKAPLDLPESLSEIGVGRLMGEYAAKNRCGNLFIGAGSYHHHVPAAVDYLSNRSEFSTAYTPYQPEISQGTLTAIFEYQTMICRLTGMDVANASMYDGATSLCEAVLMSVRTTGRTRVIVPDSLHPHYRDTLRTYAWANDLECIEITVTKEGLIDPDILAEKIDATVSAIIVQNPNFFGLIENTGEAAAVAHAHGAHCIQVVTEALSLALLKKPSESGVDIVCGEGQSFGNYIGFGGPGLGILAAKEAFTRRIPGRLVGRTVDMEGKTAYCLTLQTREQHIRRERATSNICSNEGLCALRAAIYCALLGGSLRDLALLNHKLASYMKKKCAEAGFNAVFKRPFFNEIVIRLDGADKLVDAMSEKGFSFGVGLGRWYPAYKDCILIACTEMNTPEQIDQAIDALKMCAGGKR
jgi:glycine dehydrogenase subunit 1